jgi:hypothetical protein
VVEMVRRPTALPFPERFRASAVARDVLEVYKTLS